MYSADSVMDLCVCVCVCVCVVSAYHLLLKEKETHLVVP